MHVRGGCVIHRCQNKNPIERLNSGCEWRHAPEARGGFLKSQLVELRLDTRREGSTFRARRGQTNLRATGAARDGGGLQSQNRKNVYFSPYVEEPLNSKVIKSFIPELRSRKCFSCFEIPMFYVYIYEQYMSILRIRIWLWYSRKSSCKRCSIVKEMIFLYLVEYIKMLNISW